MLLCFAEDQDQKPISKEDLPPASEPVEELHRVKRRKGRRYLARASLLLL